MALTLFNGASDWLAGFLQANTSSQNGNPKSAFSQAVTLVNSSGTEIAAAGSGIAVGATAIVGGSFSRPADTTAYASGDLIANSTTAGSVTPITINNAARVSGGTGAITGVRLSKSTTSTTNASFRVHFFKSSPTVANGDNGAFSANLIAAIHIGFVDVDMTSIGVVGSDGAKGEAAPARSVILFDCTAQALYALIEARGAYTPGNAETFTLAVEIAQD